MGKRGNDVPSDLADAMVRRLSANPSDTEAYRALHDHYRAIGDFASLANLVSGLASYTPDDRTASLAYQEVAELLDQRLGDPRRAEGFYRKALKRQPANLDASEGLQALLERGGRLRELTELIAGQVETLEGCGGDPRDIAVLCYRLGELWGKHFDRLDEALAHYRKAYELDPRLLRAVYEARQLQLQRGDRRAAVALYEKEAGAEPDPARKVLLLRELSALYEELDDVDGAVSALERAAALRPGDLELSHLLATDLLRRSHGENERARAADLDRVAGLLCDVAAGLPNEDGRPFLEAALDHAPWHDRALRELERRRDEPAAQLALAPRWVAYLACRPDGERALERRVALAQAYAAAGQRQDALFCLGPAVDQGSPEAARLHAQLTGAPYDAAVPAPQRDAGPLDTASARPPPPPAAARSGAPAASASRAQHALQRRAPNEAAGDFVTQLPQLDELDALRAQSSAEPAPWSAEPTSPGASTDALAQAADDAALAQDAQTTLRPSATTTGAPTDDERVTLRTSSAPREDAATAAGTRATFDAERAANEVAALGDDLDALQHELRSRLARNDDVGAVLVAERLTVLDPLDAEAFTFLERHYRRQRDFGARAALLVRTAQQAELPLAMRTQRLREAVSLLETRLSDIDGAVRAYQLLAALEPESDDAVRGHKRLLERTQRWDELADLLAAEAHAQTDPAAKLATLRRLTDVHRRERGDRAAAAHTLASIAELDPQDRGARVALTEELIHLGRYDEAARWIERRIEETASKSERLPLLRQLAALFAERLEDQLAAYDAYERMLEIAPDDVHALDRMEEIDEATGAHERLLTTLARRAKRVTPAQAADLHVRMATIAEADLLDRDRAGTHLRAALELAPTNLQILTALSNLYERAERYDELLSLLRERAAGEKNVKARADLQRRIGRLLASRLHDEAGAAEAFAKVLEVGNDREALLFVEARTRQQGDQSALADILRRLAEIESEPEVQAQRLFEQAELLLALDRQAEAVAPLLRILVDLAPEHAAAGTELSRLCEQLGDYRGMARVLEQRRDRATEAPARALATQELADLYEGKLPDEAKAIRALLDWSQAAPDDPAPLRRLCAIYERKRRYKDHVAALDQLATVEPSVERRIEALQQAAELGLHKLKDEAGAFQRVVMIAQASSAPLGRAVIDLARKAKKLDALCDLCESTDRQDELFALLQERIAAETDAAAKIELQRRLGRAYVELAQDEASALRTYEDLLQLTDDAEALRFVQSWSMRHDDPERLVNALGQLARIEKNRDDRRDLLVERGRVLHSRLARPREAIAALEDALALDGRFEPALAALIAACEAAPEPEKLAAALERQLANVASVDDKRAILERLAQLYEHPIGDERKAVHALTRWAELDKTDPRPWRKLASHHERSSRWRELLATLDELTQRETEAQLRLDALIAAASVAQQHLNDPGAALERLLPLVPDEEPRVDALLWELATAAGRLSDVHDAFDRAQRYEPLVAQLEQQIEQETGAPARAALLRRAALLCETQLDDEPRAARLWQCLLELQEDAHALRFMQARALRSDDLPQLEHVLARLSKLEQDPKELRDLLYEQAHLLNFRLGRPSDAVAVLQRVVFELDPEFEPALDDLQSAAEAAGDHSTLARALEHQLTREHDPAARIELAERLADLYEGPLRDSQRAITALQAWAQTDPDDLTPRRRERALLADAERPTELIACLDAIAALTQEPSEAREARRQAARLCAQALRDPDQAWQRLLPDVRAGDREAEALLRELAISSGQLLALAELYEQLQRYDELVELLRERAELQTDASAKAELYLRCARTLANAVGDELAASEAYRDVLTLREDIEALEYLRAAAERVDDIEALDELLRRLSLAHEDRAQRRDVLLARALLLNDRLDRTSDAIDVLRHIVTTIDPSCLPAIDELVATSEAVSNLPALAVGLERKLVLSRDATERRAVAARLADLYEGELESPDRAAEALRRLCEADPNNADAHRRLRVHLTRQKTHEELLRTLDALAKLEPTKAARRDAQLAAAKLAHETMGDHRAAFFRLSPLVQAGDVEAEDLAGLICKSAGLGRELAGVYIQRAQHAPNKDELRACWRQVVRIHETWLNEPAEAFEASLRLLASDTDNRDYLDEVDRLGTQVQAFGRLAQVYSKLIKDGSNDHTRVELLLRLANLLELQARDPSAALDCLLQACELAPNDTRALDRAEELASRLGSHVELLWVHEQRAARAPTDEKKALALLDAARTADIGLGDREQANTCLRRALALTRGAPALAKKIEELAGELDRARPALGKDDARRALVRAHLALAETSSEPWRSELVLRAARFLNEELHDDAAAFDVLRQGTTTPPFTAQLLDALEHSAEQLGRLDALIAHLSRSADKAQSPQDKLELLCRKARVLEQRLGRFDQAAQAYERVLELQPADDAAAMALFTCLRKAGRYRELLHAFERRLSRTSDVEQQLQLMREIANVWEVELRNRASAMEVWNEVRTLRPQDTQAQEAIERLQRL
ncbi:MAG TPA: hypothetical protein VF331_16640 [Polyangiales bacterium]